MDKKESTIKLRINEDMRSWIESRVDKEKVSMSEYLRKLILNDMRD
jgi:Arc/MetJ-type ribon-helix-helix transcriptional regulator